LQVHMWDHVYRSRGMYGGYYLSDIGNEELLQFCHALWFTYFQKPLDQLDHDWTKTLKQLRRYFFECEWFEVYDFIEFIGNRYSRYQFKERFMENCNVVLEKELSAYRFVDGLINNKKSRKSKLPWRRLWGLSAPICVVP